MYILGISGYFHDSAACLIKNGKIIAAAQEERFTRLKNDPQFPIEAIKFCLNQEKINLDQISYITFYDKPFLKFERLLDTYFSFAPYGLRSFLKAMPLWLSDKLFLKQRIKKELKSLKKGDVPPLLFTEHHHSHAASAFFPSPYEDALILCLDGVGEWATSSLWKGEGNQLKPLWQINFPHSLGLLYSAFTYYCGFKVNEGEYKLMGLAPYGEPKFVDNIYQNLIDVKEDGSFRLNMKYFNFATGLTMTNEKFHHLFGQAPRTPDDKLTQTHMDLAKSLQVVTEEIIAKLVKNIHAEHGGENLCLAGGVALNCVSNGKLLKNGPYKNIWVQPAPHDAGGALGACYATWFQYLENKRENSHDLMEGAYLGPAYTDEEIIAYLKEKKIIYQQVNEQDLIEIVANLIKDQKVIGWFQGRMEFGPRALGNRSILADPSSLEMQTTVNLKIKKRESFRPFAPAVLEEDVSSFFDFHGSSPYMLMVSQVSDKIKIENDTDHDLFGIEKLKVKRSKLPAITHVDYSARIQTISKDTNEKFHQLVSKLKELTGVGVVLNTSFNVRGEPIVNNYKDAFNCFENTEMDVLVLNNVIIHKSQGKVCYEE